MADRVFAAIRGVGFHALPNVTTLANLVAVFEFLHFLPFALLDATELTSGRFRERVAVFGPFTPSIDALLEHRIVSGAEIAKGRLAALVLGLRHHILQAAVNNVAGFVAASITPEFTFDP